MEILLVHNIPSPYRLPVFEAISRDHDLTVVFLDRERTDRKWEPELENYSFKYEFLSHVDLGPMAWNPKLCKYAFQGYDAIVVPENTKFMPSVLWLCLFASVFRVPIVLWTEYLEENLNHTCAEKYINRGLQRSLYSLTDRFIAFSEISKQHLINQGVDSEYIETEIQIIPREQIDISTYKTFDCFDSDKFSILYLGYLREEKCVNDLIEAFKRLNDNSIQLIIAGSGPKEQQLKDSAKGYNDIHFVGHVNDGKVSCYEKADLFVLPTERDAWGLVVNESLFHDTPVITTRYAGASMIESKSLRVLTDTGSEYLYQSIKNHVSESEQRAMVKQSVKDRLTNPSIMASAVLKQVLAATR